MKNTIEYTFVKCNMCEWQGGEEDLEICKDEPEEGDITESFFRGCPNCKTDDYLMDK